MKVFCKKCGSGIFLHESLDDCGFRMIEENDIYSFGNEFCSKSEEEATRDIQAGNYLMHVKIPSQIKFFQRFLSKIECQQELKKSKIVLDLGCGPGPTVKILREHGYEMITAIDFSRQSLIINKENNYTGNSINWLQVDLTQVVFEPNSVDLLIMSDFIQHVGSHADKIALVENALNALKPGGSFYLSFFNFNLINYFKSDLHGSFSNGSIPYERLISSEVCKIVSRQATISNVYPMNISHSFRIDSLVGIFPFSKYFSTMFAIEGNK